MDLVRQHLISSTGSLLFGPFALWIHCFLDTVGIGNVINTPMIVECSEFSTAILGSIVFNQRFWYSMFGEYWLEMIDYSSRCSSRSVSLGCDICCSSLRLEGIVHLGSQTNRNQPSATENWAHCGDMLLLFAAVWRFVCAQLAVSSFMSLDMSGHNKPSFALRRHFSVPMCHWCIICNIWWWSL